MNEVTENEEKKKGTIALLNDSFPPLIDGVANTVMNYADVMTREHKNAVVIVPEHPEAKDNYPYKVYRYPAIDTRKMLGYLTGVPFSSVLVDNLLKENIRVIHTHCPCVSLILSRCLRSILDAPIIFTYHTKFDVDVARLLPGKLMQQEFLKAMIEMISSVEEVWCVSEGAGQNLKSLGYKGEYVVMHNGVDMPKGRLPKETVQKYTDGYGLSDDVPVFLFVGRMFWYKGVRIILDALEGLKSQGIPFKMVFIGSGAELQDMENYAKKLGLSEECLFLGAIHDREAMRAWYCRADLFLFPSTYDTNGLVVREAAACSVATVMVKDSCASEGVTNDVNGFLISETASSMAVKLAELVKNPEKMKEVGENAARDLYISWDQAVDAAEKRYDIVCEKYRRGEYPKPKKLSDNFFKTMGNLLEFFAKVKNRKDELLDSIENE